MDPSANVPEPHASYAAFLVRLWQDSAHGPWRASAQSVQTGERTLFGSLEALFAFLESYTLINPAPDSTGSDSPEQDSPQR